MGRTRAERACATRSTASSTLACLVICLGSACSLAFVAGCDAAAKPRAAAHGYVRLVSLHDVTTEMVVALGARELLVGVSESVDADAETRRAIARVPRVAALETILAQRPTLVLGLRVVERDDPNLVERLQQAGIEVSLEEPHTLDDVYALLRSIASRVGAQAAAERVIASARSLERGQDAVHKRRPRVFVFDCCDPPFTAGRSTVLDDLITRAGGVNVFGALDAGWVHVSWEQVIALQPELVVIHDYAHAGQADVAAKKLTLGRFASLAHVPVVVIPLGCSLGGLRSVEVLERLRAAMRGLS